MDVTITGIQTLNLAHASRALCLSPNPKRVTTSFFQFSSIGKLVTIFITIFVAVFVTAFFFRAQDLRMLMSSLERRFDEFERSTDVRVRQIEDFLTRSQRDTQGRVPNENEEKSLENV